jgi:choline monooxygenase
MSQHKVPDATLDVILQPIEKATGLPNQAYTSNEFFAEERDQVLGKGWAGLWFASDLPKKGYVKPVEFMGLPLVILRNKQDEIKVFHNVCSHRGMILVHDEMEVQGALRCKYHSWSYNLDGELKGTPHLGGIGEHRGRLPKNGKPSSAVPGWSAYALPSTARGYRSMSTRTGSWQ